MADVLQNSSDVSSSQETVRTSMLRNFLQYDKKDDVLLWNGNFSQLNEFLNTILDSAANVETSEDKVHNASTYKRGDNTVRFYHTTKKVKLYGSASQTLLMKLQGFLDTNQDEPEQPEQPEQPNVNPSTSTEQQSQTSPLSTSQMSNLENKLAALYEDVELIKRKLLKDTEEKEKDLEIQKLKDEISMQKTYISNLEKQRESLLTTIALFSNKEHSFLPSDNNNNDNNSHSFLSTQSDNNNKKDEPSSRLRRNDINDNSEPSPNKTKSQRKKEKEKERKRRKKSLHTENTSPKETPEVIILNETPTNQEPAVTNHPEHPEVQPKRNYSVIVGDSIIKNLEAWRMSNRKQKVSVNPFPGSTTDDLKHYIKPIIKRRPHRLIIHIGTNDLKTHEPKVIAEKITEICATVNKELPNCEVAVSELTHRNDKPSLESARKEVNKTLKDLCTTKKMDFITHDNITAKSLNAGGLHLNKAGVSALAINFNKYLRSKQDA